MALETIFPRLFKSAEKIARPALKPFNAKSCAGNLEKNGFRTGRPDRSSAEIGVDGAQGHARGNFSIRHTIKMITFKHCRIFANATNLPLPHICQYYSLVSIPGRCNHLNGENSRKTPFLRGEVVRDKTCISALLLKHSQNSTWFNFLLYDKCELRFAET